MYQREIKKSQSIFARQNAFITERPTLAAHNADPLAVIALLQAEIAEFVEAYTNEESMDEVAREAADIIIFAATLFKTLGFEVEDIEAQVHSKIARNEAKYPQELFQEKPFPEAAAIAKKRWVVLGGDRAFYAKEEQD